MKNIYHFLTEKFNLTKISRNNTPDKILHDGRNLSYCNDYARAFIYSVKKNDLLFSKPGETHFDIIDETPLDILKEFELDWVDSISQLRFCGASYGDVEDKEEWKEVYAQENKKFKLGRIWIIPKGKMENDDILVYIAWWNELTSKEFNKYNKKVLDFFGELNEEKYEDCVFIDNNGVTKYFDAEKKVKVTKTSAQRKKELQIARNIHLASQREKKKFFAEFIKKRDRINQEKYYNHTRSKTEAEYRSIKYQESLNI